MGFIQGTQRRVRKRRGKRAISVEATEVLLYNKIWHVSMLLLFSSIRDFIMH